MNAQELEKYLPLEKSWIIRMGLLDLIHGRSQIRTFLTSEKDLNDDLLALKRVVEKWESKEAFDVGESGTLYRFLLFTSWHLDLNKKFITHGTLTQRRISQAPAIIYLGQTELLELDSGTSQWASAKALNGDPARIENPPYMLEMTYQAIDHWNARTSQNLDWQPKIDRTIQRQAEALLELLKTGKSAFKPLQAEDYCFARALNLIDAKEGERLWPALRNHESDRIASMESELKNAQANKPIPSQDHRVTQAIAIWSVVNNKSLKFKHPSSVNKSWPLFWSFLEEAQFIK